MLFCRGAGIVAPLEYTIIQLCLHAMACVQSALEAAGVAQAPDSSTPVAAPAEGSPVKSSSAPPRFSPFACTKLPSVGHDAFQHARNSAPAELLASRVAHECSAASCSLVVNPSASTGADDEQHHTAQTASNQPPSAAELACRRLVPATIQLVALSAEVARKALFEALGRHATAATATNARRGQFRVSDSCDLTHGLAGFRLVLRRSACCALLDFTPPTIATSAEAAGDATSCHEGGAVCARMGTMLLASVNAGASTGVASCVLGCPWPADIDAGDACDE